MLFFVCVCVCTFVFDTHWLVLTPDTDHRVPLSLSSLSAVPFLVIPPYTSLPSQHACLLLLAVSVPRVISPAPHFKASVVFSFFFPSPSPIGLEFPAVILPACLLCLCQSFGLPHAHLHSPPTPSLFLLPCFPLLSLSCSFIGLVY